MIKITFRLDEVHDADIISWLRSQKNKTRALKEACRNEIDDNIRESLKTIINLLSDRPTTKIEKATPNIVEVDESLDAALAALGGES